MKKLIMLCLFLTMAVPCMAEMVTVIHQPAELRAQPHVARAKVIRHLPRYTPLEVTGRQGEYLQVKDVSGKTGYLHKALVGQADSVAIKAAACNVRSGPGTGHGVVFKAAKGDIFRVLAAEQNWLNITDDAEKTGWVWKDLTWGY